MSGAIASSVLAPDFRALFESAPGLYLALTPDLKIVAVSEAYLRATMTEREAILGRGIFDVFPDNPSDPEATGVRNLRASLERVLRNKAPDTMAVQKYDVRKPKSEGSEFEVRYWSPVNSPVLNAGGEVANIIHQVEDVTEFSRLKQLESEQDKRNRELRTHAERMESEVYRRAQEVQEANRRLEKANQELAKLSAGLEARVAERTAQLAEANARLESELAERTRLEQQLLQSQKMEAVGRLAGGVAHDFNNLLTVILGYSQFLLMDAPEGSTQQDLIREITRASEQAAALTRQLLAFSRQQLLEIKVLDLNAVVADVGKMLSRLIGEDVNLVTSLAEDLGRIKADPTQIEQVVLNLAVNARDAMPRGGKLTIETANVELEETHARHRLSLEPGPYVMLAMSDTGVGMDAKIQERIFEPFFTTKERGKGTGLGLSTVYGVVKQSGGSIGVSSEMGRGTTFTIYLPRVDEVAKAPAPPPESDKRPEGTETILLIEDAEAVRSLIHTTLQSHGYIVLEASASSDALEFLAPGGKSIDLVLTDVVMPGMSGRELAEAARATNPGLKVLYMSGYTDDAVLRHGVLEPGNHFIQKPFRPVDLVRKIREVLDVLEGK
jgi:signal transduction histidine kinase